MPTITSRLFSVICCAIALSAMAPMRARAQVDCTFQQSATPGLTRTNVDELRCLARQTKARQVLAMTFAAWCTPCRAHLPGAIEFARKNGLEFIVIVPEAENDAWTADAARLVHRIDSTVRVLVISDSYGASRNPKYKRFLKEIIPPTFPVIDDYSKYILFSKTGEVVFVSSWKDNRKYDWRVDTAVQNQRILPLLSNN